MTDFTLKGRHVLAMFVLGFGTIIAVNLTLAVNAVRTFPGLETANSYVASQEYDARRAAQEALGWRVEATGEGGVAAVALVDSHGLPADPQRMQAVIGRATTDEGERVMPQTGRAAAALEMPEGYWRVDVTATAPDGTPFEQRLTLHVTP